MIIRKTQQPSDYPSNSISNTKTTGTTNTYSCDYINSTITSIIKSGANQNGHYIKFSDGTMICYNKGVCTDAIQTAYGATYRPENEQTCNFPASFIDTDIKIIITPLVPLNSAYLSNWTTSGFNYWPLSFIAREASTKYVYYVAIGKWK